MARKNEYTENLDKLAGQRIKELRLAKGLSRQQLACKIGVTNQQLQKYEKSTNRIAFGRMCAIALALGKPLAYFVDQVDENNGASITQYERLTIEMSRNFSKIQNSSNQYAVNQLVRTLAQNG